MIEIFDKSEISARDVLRRDNSASGVEDAVAGIIAAVRRGGDRALREYAEKFDGGAPERFEVSPEEMDEAAGAVGPEFIAVLEEAARNIRDFHERQRRQGFVAAARPGRVMGQNVIPLRRAGIYVPGGTASYPSTVLMNVIPASVAGVDEIVVVSPAKNGRIDPAILAAAKIAGAHRVFRCGGAQAIAALAYGTESIPAVDKITGPGNVFVAEAKRQVYGQVAIDMIAGPSEILIVSDGKTNAKWLAADMLSQAEHDKLATAILITDSAALAAEVAEEIERQLAALPREEIARASIENNGKIIVAGDLEDAVAIANEIAPEHLELCVDAPFDYLGKVKNAGSIFLGRYSPEPVGDYLAGTNHTLPTMGTARFSSPLSVDDFVKKSCFSYYTPAALEAAADDIALFADAEGLHGHAVSATIRREG